MRERNKKISFWVTETEKKQIKKAAQKTGLGEGEYLRLSALGKNIFCIEELRPMLRELKGIGRNLNQMTVMAHKGLVRSVELNTAVDMLTRNYTALNRLYDVANSVVTSGGKMLRDGDL